MNIKLNKKLIISAIAIALLPSQGHTESLTAVFDMYDPTDALINTDTTVTGSIDLTAVNAGAIVDGTSTWAVQSTQLFFGLNWTASSGVLYGPGTHTISLDDSGTGGVGTPGQTATITVGSNQVMGNIKFAWGASTGIDVIDLWNVSYTPTGVATFTNTDADSPLDGAPGWGMQDGPFVGFEAVFNLTVQPAFTTNLQVTQGGNPVSILDPAGGVVSVTSGVTAASPTYNWNNGVTDAAIITLAGGSDSTATLTFDPALLSSGSYVASLTVSSSSPSGTVRADTPTFTVPSIILSALTDIDGDGTMDNADGFGDSDNDGIPDYLDNTVFYTDPKIMPLSITANTSAAVMTISEGTGTGATLVVGATAQAKYNGDTESRACYNDGTGNCHGPVLNTSDLSTDVTQSSCVGGCFDFEITGLNTTTADIIQVVIPLSAAIPEDAVYRKYDTNADLWGGFEKDANNSLASAAALSTGPTTCPAPGDASYTTGLTQGHFCLQMTIEDNGPNDSDTTLGTIADPGGIAGTDQFNPENSGEVDAVGGGWWLLMGFPALFGMRRLAKK